MKKRILILSLLLVLMTSCAYAPTHKDSTTDLYDSALMNFDFGDEFIGFEIQTMDKKTIETIPTHSQNKLIIYLSEGCSTCIEVLRSLNRLENIFLSDQFDYLICWENQIPVNLVEKYEVEKDKNVSLKGETRLSSISPTFFLLNEDNIVDFSTSDFQIMIDKLFSDEILTKNQLQENANKYILDKLANSDETSNLIFFSMEGCPDCMEVEPIISSNIIQNIYDVTTIYRSNDPKDGRLLDNYNIFRHVYDIEWYPSFLILDGIEDYYFIGETSIENLENLLLRPQ